MFEALLVGKDFAFYGFRKGDSFGDECVEAYWTMTDMKVETYDCCNRYHLFIRSASLLRSIERMAGFKGFLNNTRAQVAAKQRRDVRGEFHGMIVMMGEPNVDRGCDTGLGG